MLQIIITYSLLAASLIYVGRRIYHTFKKKSACNNCGLMNEAKKHSRI